ncbi:conserved hypothetical protein [Aspergillus udagawae]|uniref:Uncharacterized protein n=1 Tax=Aspergillus udagawae TaxID=91492 RepID=A0ABQ1A6M7_9EURO|nr:conserved hypothetical protein [Aspergillus udagawae]
MDGSMTYYVNDEYVTYPANESRYPKVGSYGGYQEYKHEAGFVSQDYYTGNRYSRDVQFTVRCPDAAVSVRSSKVDRSYR